MTRTATDTSRAASASTRASVPSLITIPSSSRSSSPSSSSRPSSRSALQPVLRVLRLRATPSTRSDAALAWATRTTSPQIGSSRLEWAGPAARRRELVPGGHCRGGVADPPDARTRPRPACVRGTASSGIPENTPTAMQNVPVNYHPQLPAGRTRAISCLIAGQASGVSRSYTPTAASALSTARHLPQCERPPRARPHRRLHPSTFDHLAALRRRVLNGHPRVRAARRAPARGECGQAQENARRRTSSARCARPRPRSGTPPRQRERTPSTQHKAQESALPMELPANG